jgi:hypothetical protein
MSLLREVLMLAVAGVLVAAPPSHADDCSSPSDCQVPPRNIDAATGLAAGAAAVVLYTQWWRRRHAASAVDGVTDDDPCADVRRQVELGEETIKELERRAGQWKRPTPPPEGWPAPTTGHGPYLPPLPETTGGHGPFLPPLSGPATSGTGGGTLPPAAPSSAGRLAGVLGLTPGGKRKVMICKPIIGPNGQITGYAMTEQEVDDVPPQTPDGMGTTDNTVKLPGGRRLHIDPMEEWLTGTSTVAEALERERADQKRRVAALAACHQAAVPATGEKPKSPADVKALAQEVDDAIKRFEELQKQLKEEVGNQLNQFAKFNDDYNRAWNRGMDGLDKYLHTYLQLLPGLKNLFDTFVDRNTALEMGHAIDEKIHQAIGAVMAVEGAAGLIRGVAKWAAEEAAVEAAEGAAGLATKEGVAGLDTGAEGVASKGVQKGVLESAGEAAGKEGAEGATEGVVRKAEGEGLDTVKGGGEGRPADWETQKLGPDGKPVEVEASPEMKSPPRAPEEKLPGAKDETVGPPRESVGDKTDIQPKTQDQIRQEAANRARDRDWQRRFDDAMKDSKTREEAWFEAQDSGGRQAGESIQEMRERILRETAFARTGNSPVMHLNKIEGAERQLEVLSSGREYLGVKPTPENIEKVYQQYLEGVNGARKGVEIFPNDYLQAVRVDDAAKLSKVINQETPLSHWLDKLKAVGG